MKPNSAKIISTWLAVTLLLAGMVSHAAVSVVGTPQTATTTTSGTTTLTISGFNMGAGNCLVVTAGGKTGSGNWATPTVTFGGSALDGTTSSFGAVQANNGATIIWAINPTKRSGDVVVTFNPAISGGAVTVMSLSGVGQITAGGTATANGTTGGTFNLTYNCTINGVAIISGSDSTSTATPTIGGVNFTTPNYTIRNSYNSCPTAQTYSGTIASSGSSIVSTYTSGTGTSKRIAAAAAAFDPGYVVTYDGNGKDGGTAPNNAGYASGATVTVAANSGTLTKTGYTFAGWNTQADGNGTTYTAGSGSFTISADTTLYAKWTAASATITATPTTFPSALTTTYGTASSEQPVSVSGSGLTVDITATVSTTGLEISKDNSTWGNTVTFTQSGGNASGTLYIRLMTNAPVSGTYNAQTVALTSSGAAPVNVATTSSGNAVTAKNLTVNSPSVQNKTFDGTTTATIGGTFSGVVNNDTITLSGTFANSDPGNNKAVTFLPSGANAGNYTVTQPGLTANIAGTSITLNSADANGTSSFNGSTNWSIAAAPVAGNTYATAFNLRTPTSGSTTFAGDSLTIQTGGTLAIKSAASTTVTANNLILNGGNISQSDQSAISGGTMGLAGNITASANAAVTAARSGTTTDTLDITAPISGGSGVTLTIGSTTSGTVRFSGANTFSGTVTVNGTDYSSTAGVLQLNNLNAVQSSTLNLATSMSGVAGLTFNSAANTGTFNIGTLAGANVATTFALKDTASAAVAISVGANNASTTYAGIITDSGSLTKVGNGTLTLSGANTYSGNTTINGGTLQVDGASGAINSSSGITINGSGTKYLHTAGTANTRTITQTLGTVDGTGTLGTVNVANNSANVVQNGNGGTTPLAIGTLAFSGAATLNVAQSGTTGTSGIGVTGALTTTPGSGTVTINATIAGGTWSSGTTYNLVHSASGSLNVSDFTKGTIAGLTGRQSASLVQVDENTIGLQITGDAPKWTGLDSANWVAGSTGASGNWQLITGSTATDYIPGDSVTFDDSATVAHNAVNISAANVSPTATIFNNSSVSYTVGGSFGIAAGTLIVNGGGTVNLNTPNTYSGSTTISSSSTLNLGGSLGSTAISVGSGSALSETAGGVIGGSASLASSGSTTLAGANTYSGGTTLSAGQLNINNGGDATHSAIGTGALTISGGTIDNTSSGDVSLSPAITQNWNSDFTYAGSVHNLNLGTGAVTLGANRQVTVSANTLTVGGVIGGSYSLTKTGNGTLTLLGVNTYSGITTVNGGKVSVSADAGLGTAPGSTVANQLTLNGGELSVPTGFAMNSKRGINLGASGGTISVASGQTLSYSYLISGPGNLTKNGDGTLDLTYSSTDHTYGNLTLNAGTITMNKSSALGTGTVTINGGTIRTSTSTVRSPANAVQLNGDVTLGASGTGSLNFTGPWTINGASRTITVDSITATNGAAIGEDASGRGLTKAGSGALVLSAANTYSGATTVSGGVLLVNNPGSLVSDSAVTVENTATLRGNGAINGSVTVNSGGTLAPGAAAIGTLTLGSTLSLAGTANFRLNKSGSTLTGDSVAGATSITAGGTLNVTATGNALAANDSFTLLNTGAGSSWFSSVSLPDLSSGLSWDTNHLATAGILDVYTFTTTDFSGSMVSNTVTTISAPKWALYASSSKGAPVAVAATASHGTPTISAGALTYTPNTDYVGDDTISVTMGDGHSVKSLAIMVHVTTVNSGNTSLQLTPTMVEVEGVNHYQISTSGMPNQNYHVQAITDGNGAWSTIATTTAANNGVVSWTDPDPISAHQSRIYRLAQ